MIGRHLTAILELTGSHRLVHVPVSEGDAAELDPGPTPGAGVHGSGEPAVAPAAVTSPET